MLKQLVLKVILQYLDTDDQKKLIKKICEAENIDAKKISPQFIIAFIDNWKNKGLMYDDVKKKVKKTISRDPNFKSLFYLSKKHKI